MKLFFYCKRQLQIDMTYTWSQITITSWLFKNVCSVFYMLVIHVFSDIRNLQIISSGAFWNSFWKFFKNHTQLLGFFLRANNHCFVFRLCIILETLVDRSILAICSQNCLPHGVGAKAPSSPKVSVPRGKPNKFLKIDKEVFRLLIPLHYTKMLKNSNGHCLSFVKSESMQLLFWGSV